MASVGSLLGGFAGSTIGAASVQLFLDSSRYTKGLAQAKGELVASTSSTSAGLTKLGATAALGFGVVAAAGVAAAVKLTVAFEDTFTQIGALSNTSEKQLEQWKGQVLGLAGEVAQAPQELAEALYFLSSAGLDTTQVMGALEIAAKGSAVGLGTTADVANITASAMNAYAKEGLSAAQVTDTLVAAVREGRAEPDAFAEAIGRILPIASKAGVSFDEVTASLAGLSNIGLDVNEGVTAMRGLLGAMTAPGTLAAEALAGVGVTADELRRVLAEDGLLGAMQLLEEATNGDIDVLRKIIPNIRSLTGQFGITGQEAEKVAAIFDNVKNSTGALAQAFKETQESPGFKLQQLLAKLQVLAIKLGEALLPVVKGLIDGMSALVDQLTPLISNLGQLALVIGTVTAAWLVLNRVIVAVKLLEVASSVGATAAAFATMVAPIYAVYKGIKLANEEIDAFQERDFEGVLGAIAEGARLVGIQVPDMFGGEGQSDVDSFKAGLADVETALKDGAITAEAAAVEVSRLATEFGVGLPQGAAKAVDALQETWLSGKDLAGGFHVVDQAVGTASRALGRAANQTKRVSEVLREFRTDISEAMVDAIGSVSSFSRKWALTAHQFLKNSLGMLEKTKEFNRALRELAKDREVIPKPYLDYLLREGPDAVVAFTELTKAQQREAIRAFGGQQQVLRENEGLIKKLTGSVGDLQGKIAEVGRTKARAEVEIHYTVSGAKISELPGLAP